MIKKTLFLITFAIMTQLCFQIKSMEKSFEISNEAYKDLSETLTPTVNSSVLTSSRSSSFQRNFVSASASTVKNLHRGFRSLIKSFAKDSDSIKTVKFINTTGLLELDNVIVEESVDLVGMLYAENCTIGAVNISGDAYFNNSTIKNPSIINGLIRCISASFYNSLSVAAEKMSFEGSSLMVLEIPELHDYKGIQVVKLLKNTKVYGSISFKSGKGEVWLYDNSVVNGIVQGGTVIKK